MVVLLCWQKQPLSVRVRPAGVIEIQLSADPVRIGDNVLVGANVKLIAFRLVTVQSLLLELMLPQDVPENVVVAGVPARIIGGKTMKNTTKTSTEDACVTCNRLIVEACKASKFLDSL